MKVFLTTNPDTLTSTESFYTLAKPIVEHPQGWKGVEVTDDRNAADCVVTLATDSTIVRMFPQFADTHLSVCEMGPRNVWINESRWLRLIPDKSQLSLPAYRIYVLQHELGHALGHGHAKHTEPGQPAPVMIQQTLGIGASTPNPFPTKSELANQYMV